MFVLIGLQLPGIVAELRGRSPLMLLGMGVLVSISVILIRFIWVLVTDVLRLGDGAGRPRAWREDVLVSWAGRRGVVSLAAVLSLPLTTSTGAPFPERNLLILLTVCVIVTTLIGQGLSLPWLLRRLRLQGDGVELHTVCPSSQSL